MFVCPVARSGLDWWPRSRRSAALLRCDALRIVSACPSASVALFRLRSAPSSTVSLLPCLLLVRRASECAWSEWLLHTGRRCRHPPLSVRCAADQADVALLLVALLRCHHPSPITRQARHCIHPPSRRTFSLAVRIRIERLRMDQQTQPQPVAHAASQPCVRHETKSTRRKILIRKKTTQRDREEVEEHDSAIARLSMSKVMKTEASLEAKILLFSSYRRTRSNAAGWL